MKACAVITLVLVTTTAYIGVEAWGGLFNRFSPEMLSNLGYGGHGSYMNRPGLLQVCGKVLPFYRADARWHFHRLRLFRRAQSFYRAELVSKGAPRMRERRAPIYRPSLYTYVARR